MGLIRNDLQNENNDVPKKRLKYNGLRIFAFFFQQTTTKTPSISRTSSHSTNRVFSQQTNRRSFVSKRTNIYKMVAPKEPLAGKFVKVSEARITVFSNSELQNKLNTMQTKLQFGTYSHTVNRVTDTANK